jgi:hypothetical protein
VLVEREQRAEQEHRRESRECGNPAALQQDVGDAAAGAEDDAVAQQHEEP